MRAPAGSHRETAPFTAAADTTARPQGCAPAEISRQGRTPVSGNSVGASARFARPTLVGVRTPVAAWSSRRSSCWGGSGLLGPVPRPPRDPRALARARPTPDGQPRGGRGARVPQDTHPLFPRRGRDGLLPRGELLSYVRNHTLYQGQRKGLSPRYCWCWVDPAAGLAASPARWPARLPPVLALHYVVDEILLVSADGEGPAGWRRALSASWPCGAPWSSALAWEHAGGRGWPARWPAR